MKTAIVLSVAIAAVLAASLMIGDQDIPLRDIYGALTGDNSLAPGTQLIVVGVRLPRAVLAFLVGCSLAVGGAIAQSAMRNPLAEPGLLGTSAGAALAITFLVVRLKEAPVEILPWAAFAGALAATFAVYLLSWRGGLSSGRVVLIGIGVSALAAAATNFISVFGDITAVQRAMIWISGSVYDSRWVKVQSLALWFLPALIITWLAARELDLLTFDDVSARALGQSIDRVRVGMLFLCSAISGAAVAAVGLIAFVGLIAPHIARRYVGPDHAVLIPVSALTGGLLVLASDLIGRTVIAPAHLPVGLVTALLGAPFFGYLMWKKRYG